MAKLRFRLINVVAPMNSSPNENRIELASLSWDADGQPLSNAFGDVYFSKANGLEETRHVFLTHNQLEERWKSLAPHTHFTIGETGFGSGLNFLAAWELWLKTAPDSAQLHFVSAEKYPLQKSDLIKALALWPELNHLADQLIDSYPDFVGTGFHRLNFMDGKIKLTLIIDDAAQGFSKLLATTHPLFIRQGIIVDAWFLDGFAPSKNPQMWSDALFNCIHNLSDSHTTAATFSAAAIVKNGLKAAGFTVEKVAGFGRKREMVKAYFTAEPLAPNPDDYRYRGSFSPYPVPWTINKNTQNAKDKHAIVIGGGLAGCHSARALAERGWKVTLVERHAHLAQEGSGNPQGALYAKLSPLDEAQAAFNLASLQFAFDSYRPHWQYIGEQCGVLQLAHKPSEKELHHLLREKFTYADQVVKFVSAEQASELAGIPLNQDGLFFPQAGWINPRKLCAHLVKHANISVEFNQPIQQLHHEDCTWVVTTEKGAELQAPVVIIASAKDALQFEQANHLPVKTIRGQVTYIPEQHLSLSNSASPPFLKTVVCAEGYISPAQDGVFCTGATFNLKDSTTETRILDHKTNLDNLRTHIPVLDVNVEPETLSGRVAFRCSLPDYLPCVGPLPIVDRIIEDFSPLRKNARAGITASGSYFPGLYINIGQGSRGLAYTPLCAELLAALINNEPCPLSRDLVNALHPARFLIRDLIRNKR